MRDIGDRIRELRMARGMSQAELAERIGKRRSAIGNYESGAREPDLDTLDRLAEALGVSLAGLLDDEERAEDDAVWEVREALRRRPEMRLLFDAAKGASADDLRRAAAMVDALRRTNPDFREDE